MSTDNPKGKRGVENHLNDEQRVQILELVEQPSSPCLRSIAIRFDVSDTVLKKLIKNKEEVQMRAQQEDDKTRKPTLRAAKDKYLDLEECLYAWIDASRRLSITLPPFFTVEKN